MLVNNRFLFLILLFYGLTLKATTEKVVAFFNSVDQRTMFTSEVPYLNFSKTYEHYFKSSVVYDQKSLYAHDIDQHEKIISDYLSQNPSTQVFIAIGVGRYMVDSSFTMLSFINKLCPLKFNNLSTEQDLDNLLLPYGQRLFDLKKSLESKFSTQVNFIYLGGQIRPEFFDDKKGWCGRFMGDEKMKTFYSTDIIRVLTKKIGVVYSPLFSASLFNYYQKNGSVDEINKTFFNMMIPYIN